MVPVHARTGAVAAAAGNGTEPYAEGAFFRCISMAEQMEQAAASGAMDPDEASEFIVCALDCIRWAHGHKACQTGLVVLPLVVFRRPGPRAV